MIGQLLNERYRLEAELGQGGMGVVYRAHDMLLDRDVAAKVLSSSGLSAQGRARLLREAQAAARLNHPNPWDFPGAISSPSMMPARRTDYASS